MPDRKYKTPNGQIVNGAELQSKYGEKFNSLVADKTFSEVTEPVYKTPNGKFETESVLTNKYGDKFNELKANNTFILDAPLKKKKILHLLHQIQMGLRYRKLVLRLLCRKWKLLTDFQIKTSFL